MTNFARLLVILGAITPLLGSCNQLTARKNTLANNRRNTQSFSFSYQLTAPSLPGGAKSVEVIVPSPSSDDKQTISNFRVTSNLTDSQYIDPEYNNNILVFNSGDSIPQGISITLTFDVIRKQRAPIDSLSDAEVGKSSVGAIPDSLRKYILPNALVPIDGPIRREADSVVNDSMTSMEKARALYVHLFETMKYDKSGAGWGNGDALYACDVRRGNCTDIHSLFIGMARSQGIPARFRIGFPLPEGLTAERTTISGYHCWAEFYLADVGWIPVDISEAINHPAKKEYYFGRLDPHRIGFTVGRDIVTPSRAGEYTFNYLIYPQVFVDGERFEDVERRFTVSES